MYQNHRAYQYTLSKTGCAPLAAFAAFGARTVGRLAAELGCLKYRGGTSFEQLVELSHKVDSIYPLPFSSAAQAPALLPADPAVDVSVVMPVHNGEAFLEHALDCVLQQNTSRRLQVIVVEDGSTDRSAEILTRYAQAGRITFLQSDPPGGTAAQARNLGIQCATGRYLMFVDCDDLLCPDAVEQLCNAAEELDADIVQGGWYYLDETDRKGSAQQYPRHLYTGATRLDALELPGVPWGKLFRRELFAQIRFPASYSCFEDAVIHVLVFQAARRIASVPGLVIGWRKNSAGLTSTSQHAPRALQAYWIMEELLAQHYRLGLAEDAFFQTNTLLQLSNFCYVCVSGMAEDETRSVFACCALLYQNLDLPELPGLPYAARLARRALSTGNFELWKLQGRLFQLIA